MPKKNVESAELINLDPSKPLDIFAVIDATESHQQLEKIKKAIMHRKQFIEEYDARIEALEEALLTDHDQNLQAINKQLLSLYKEKQFYLNFTKKFIKTIEASDSPQEVDSYVDTINSEIRRLLGNPENISDPTQFEKFKNFLKKMVVQYTEKGSSADKTAAVSESASIGIRSYLPLFGRSITSVENWEDPSFIVNTANRTIAQAKKLINTAYENCYNKASQGDFHKKNLLRQKIGVLRALRQYAATSKKRFKRSVKFSSGMMGVSSVFYAVSILAIAARLIPPANLIADGVSKAADFVSYASWTAALKQDPNISPEEFLAVKRHFEWLRFYNKGEASIGGVGTLALVVGFAVSLTALAATLPALGPGLLVAGTVTMVISNVFSAIAAHSELVRERDTLNKHPLIKELPAIIAKSEKNINTLNYDEKKLFKQHQLVQALEHKFRCKILNTIGATATSIMAIAAVVALVAFPPAGLLITGTGLFVFIAITCISAIGSAYNRYKQLQHDKQFQKTSELLEKDDARIAVDTIKQAQTLGKAHKKAAKAGPELSSELSSDLKKEVEVEPAQTKVITFTHTATQPKTAPESSPHSPPTNHTPKHH